MTMKAKCENQLDLNDCNIGTTEKDDFRAAEKFGQDIEE